MTENLLNFCDQIGFLNVREGDRCNLRGQGLFGLCFLFDGGEVKRERVVFESCQAAGEMAVIVDWGEGLNFDQAALETVVVGGLEELAFEARAADFERVFGAGDQVFDVENGAKVAGEVGAVFVGGSGKGFDRNTFGKAGFFVRCGLFSEFGAGCGVFFEEDAEQPVLGAAGELEVHDVKVVRGRNAVGSGANCL